MKITWYGHSAFRIEIKNAVILIDPFITGNCKAPVAVEDAAKGVTHILVSHGHPDHVGDTVEIARKTNACVTANYEVCCWLERQGVKTIRDMNPGGEIDLGPFRLALTVAHHTSSAEAESGKPIYLGSACGLVVMAPHEPTLYHAGDTDIFSDMALIDDFYAPEIGMLPIGDVYTMGGKKAAEAAKRFFGFAYVFPMHYGTFPQLDQTPDRFVKAMAGSKAKVLTLEPGGSIEIQPRATSSTTRGAA